MEKIIQERMTVVKDGDFVVFLIGMRVNSFWKIHKWLPVFLAMPKMIKELYADPSIGFVSQESWFGRTTIMVQYWQSFDQLEQYAKNTSKAHLPAWHAFNKKVASNGDVGIWHETYVSKPGQFECVYNNMPRFGLAKTGEFVPARGTYKSASDRMHVEN